MTTDPIEKAHLTSLTRERTRRRLDDALALLVAHWPGAMTPMRPEGDSGHLPPRSRPPLNPAALSTRDAAWRDLRSWGQLVMEERGTTEGPRSNSGPDVALWLGRHSEWLAGHDTGPDAAEELHRHGRAIRDLDKGYYSRKFQLPGACPEPTYDDNGMETGRCPGGLWALMRQEHGLLPQHVTCDGPNEHQWAPHQWHHLGRRITLLTRERMGA